MSTRTEATRRSRHHRSRGIAGAAAAFLVAAGAVASAGAVSVPSSTAQLQSINALPYKSILVNSAHHALYVLPAESTTALLCKTTCLTTFPPMLVPSTTRSVTLGTGVRAHIGFVKRSSTTKQVTFNGHPLYRYSGDKVAGSTSGIGLAGPKGIWDLVHAGATTSAGSIYLPQPALLSANVSTFSHVLVNSHGRTLYTLSVEGNSKFSCTGACLSIWPPVLVPNAISVYKVGAGVAGHIAFVARTSTMKQVTFNGFPLYIYSGDGGPGQAYGQGIVADGGTWYVNDATATTTGTTEITTGGGGGY
jgi:predicted lipoprotein with Yx(FWY)xxD motif